VVRQTEAQPRADARPRRQLGALARASSTLTPPVCLHPQYNDQLLQLFTSSLYIAGMASSLAASRLTRTHGRRALIAAAALAFLAGAALSAGAVHVSMVVIGRVLLGVGVGFGNTVIPLYLSEMAPRHLRGAINILFQLATTLGILGAQLINYGVLRPTVPHGWRISLALVVPPALFLAAASAFLPDTPASLHLRGYPDEALSVLKRSRGAAAAAADVEDEMAEIADASERAVAAEARGKGMLLRREYRPELTMAVMIPFFQQARRREGRGVEGRRGVAHPRQPPPSLPPQITGINSIMFYAPVILASVGFGASAALLNTVREERVEWVVGAAAGRRRQCCPARPTTPSTRHPGMRGVGPRGWRRARGRLPRRPRARGPPAHHHATTPPPPPSSPLLGHHRRGQRRLHPRLHLGRRPLRPPPALPRGGRPDGDRPIRHGGPAQTLFRGRERDPPAGRRCRRDRGHLLFHLRVCLVLGAARLAGADRGAAA
jgi:MFS family permease